MSEEKSSLAKDIEDLVSKSIEANKAFINEGMRMVKQFTSQPGDRTNINIFQPELISNAISAYAKLNIQHMKNVLDLGVSLAKKAGTDTAATESSDTDTANPKGPAFVLNGSGEQGSVVALQFLLDNIKEQAVTCELVHTPYTNENGAAAEQEPATRFSPQSFELKAGESQTVDISVSIPVKTNPGVYTSHVQVKGFEPAYFSIYLTVTEKTPKTSVHGSRKRK